MVSYSKGIILIYSLESYNIQIRKDISFKKFDLEQITQHIIFAQKVLHKIELKKKEEHAKT